MTTDFKSIQRGVKSFISNICKGMGSNVVPFDVILNTVQNSFDTTNNTTYEF